MVLNIEQQSRSGVFQEAMMFKFSRNLSRAALVAITLAGAAGFFFATGTEPAVALCKYGTPHCINKNPGPKLPTVGGVKIPDSGWVDPDCKYYGNCDSSEVKGVSRTQPSGKRVQTTGGRTVR
jgi:hypothetical protein